jgi:RNase P protein component
MRRARARAESEKLLIRVIREICDCIHQRNQRNLRFVFLRVIREICDCIHQPNLRNLRFVLVPLIRDNCILQLVII